MLRILLADDHTIFREGVRALLEGHGFRVEGEAADGREAARIAERLHPDVAVLDVGMPLLNGLDAAQAIARVSPATRSILLTMHAEDPYVTRALQAGVHGYVLKSQASEDLIQAIRDVSRGGIYLSPGVSGTLVEAYLAKQDIRPDPLSLREREVVQLIAEGKSTKEVAALLGVSIKTAESHRTRIMSKLDIHETASLVRYAIRQGLVRP